MLGALACSYLLMLVAITLVDYLHIAYCASGVSPLLREENREKRKKKKQRILRHDTQHNNIQHNDTQHNDLQHYTK